MSSEVSSSHYVKIWGILLALLVVSICGPMLEIKWVTLVTAFGIAVVKALLVAKHFMHLSIERRYVTYMLLTMLLLMLMLFFGIAVDIMMPSGSNWEKIPMEIPAAAPHH
jgi:caa(3)-type oxidase subunit IV